MSNTYRNSPDLAACDLWAFLRLKCELQANKFSSEKYVVQATAATLSTMSQTYCGSCLKRGRSATKRSAQLGKGVSAKKKTMPTASISVGYTLM
jgi:hypothetical protein